MEVALTDGGLETTLIFHDGIDLPCFAAFPLVEHDEGRSAIRRYFAPFLDEAEARDLPFVLDLPTWRASPDWGAQLGYDTAALAAATDRSDRVAAWRGCAGSSDRAWSS